MSYTAMMAARRYRIIRSTNPPDGERQEIVEATGLDWDAAVALANQMQRHYDDQHPGQTDSWVKDLFIPVLENGEAIKAQLLRERFDRAKEAREKNGHLTKESI